MLTCFVERIWLLRSAAAFIVWTRTNLDLGEYSRCHDESRRSRAWQTNLVEFLRRCSAGKLGAGLGFVVALAAAGCGDGESAADNQTSGLSPGGSAGSGGGGAGERGGTAATGSGGAGGAGASVPSGGAEGSLPDDIPLGGAGTNVDSLGGAADAGVEADAGVLPPEPTGFVPCPTDGTPCRIMPLGDSITDGIDQTINYAS